MEISFQKINGSPSLGVAFFWLLQIEVETPTTITDYFIPELFYDYLLIQQGSIEVLDTEQGSEIPLGRQTLKTLFTHQLRFTFSTPLVVYGARLDLRFAETHWGEDLYANSFLSVNWIEAPASTLPAFASAVTDHIRQRATKKRVTPLLLPTLRESDWLAAFSPRHKRRLYKKVFGLSRADMRAIRSIQNFLGKACDFTTRRPRIIEHIDSETFYDQPHLNRSFKKMTGFSPLAYFQANSILQDNLMAASYNERSLYDTIM